MKFSQLGITHGAGAQVLPLCRIGAPRVVCTHGIPNADTEVAPARPGATPEPG